MTSLVFILLAAAQSVPAPPLRPVPELRDRSEAYYHFSLGLQARFSGETQTALEEYRKAQKLDPGSAAIRVETARLLREAGKIDEALGEAREAVRLDQDNSDAHLALAQLYQLQAAGAGGEGALRKAAAELEEVVRLQPTDRDSLVFLASLYGQQLQDHKEAARIWQLYVGLDPGSFEAHIQEGTHLLAAGQPGKAAAALKDALELQPGSARVYQTLGDIYAQAEQTDQAVLHYRKALEIEPANLRVRLGLTETFYRARKYKEALAEAQKVLASDARNRFALNLKGQALRDLREFDAAEEAANAILEEAASGYGQDPGERQAAYLQGAYLKVQIAEGRRDFAAAASQLEIILARSRSGEDVADAASRDRVFLIHLGFAYQQQGKFTEAASAFGRAKRVGGDPDAALLGYGSALMGGIAASRGRYVIMGDADDSYDFLEVPRFVEKLRQGSPKDIKVLGQVADFYRRARRFPEAETALREARELEPKNLGTLFQLGAVLERQQRHDEADQVFREALKVEPNSAPVLNYVGYMNADRNVKVEEALEMIQRALALEPNNSAYLDSLGWALFRLGRLDAAEESVRKALGRQDKNAVILDHLGDILQGRGRTAEALESWQKALRGEDDEGELDRARVERKIRDAQSGLRAQQTP